MPCPFARFSYRLPWGRINPQKLVDGLWVLCAKVGKLSTENVVFIGFLSCFHEMKGAVFGAWGRALGPRTTRIKKPSGGRIQTRGMAFGPLIRGVPEAFGRKGPKREIGPSGRGSRGSESLRAERSEARSRAFGSGDARIGKPPGGAVRNVGNGLRAWNHADQEARRRKGPKRGERPSGKEPRGSGSLRAERSERGDGPSGL
jgi:hypothetical protein